MSTFSKLRDIFGAIVVGIAATIATGPAGGLAALSNFAVISSIAAYAATYYTIVDSRRKRREAAQAAEDNKKQPEISQTSTVMPRQRVYGMRRVGGLIAYWKTWGPENRTLSVVVVLADHPCEDILDIYFDDKPLYINWATGKCGENSEYFNSNVQLIVEQPAAVSGVITLSQTPKTTASVSILDGYTTVPTGGAASDSVTAVPTPLVAGIHYTHTPPSTTVTLQDYLTGQSFPAEKVWVSYQADVGTALVSARKYLGSVPQTADATLMAIPGGEWTSACRLDGQTYFVIDITWDETKTAAGLPNPSAILKGNNQIYDPRTSTTGYTDNWALCVRDYLKYAFNSTESEFDDTVTNDSADNSDETVAVEDGTVKRYTVNAVLSSNTTRGTILETLLLAGVGSAAWSAGKWRILSGKYRNPVNLTLTESDVVSAVSIRTRLPRKDLFNTVRGKYYDSRATNGANLYTYTEYAPYASSAYITEDNGEELSETLDFEAVVDYRVAHRLAKQIMHRSRQAQRVIAKWKLRTLPLQVGDVVPVSLDRYGIGAGPRVVSAVTKASTAAVTTAVAHGLSTNMVVTFDVTGMTELNGNAYRITVTSGTTFTLASLSGTPVNSSAYGTFTGGLYTAYKCFEVLERTYDFPAAIELVLQETTPEVYDWNYLEVPYLDPSPNSMLASPVQVADLTLNVRSSAVTDANGSATIDLLADGSFQPYVLVSWAARTIAGEYVEIRWRRLYETGSRKLITRPGETEVRIVGVGGGDRIHIEGVAINALGARSRTFIVQDYLVDPNLPKYGGALQALSANLLRNASLDVTTGGWASQTYNLGGLGSPFVRSNNPAGLHIPGSPSNAYIYCDSTASGNGPGMYASSAPFPVRPGDTMAFFAYLCAYGTDAFVSVHWFNESDVRIGGASGNRVSGSTVAPYGRFDKIENYEISNFITEVPAGARTGRLAVDGYGNWSSSVSSKHVSILQPFAGVIPEGVTDMPPWDPGGQNIADTATIADNAVSRLISFNFATAITLDNPTYVYSDMTIAQFTAEADGEIVIDAVCTVYGSSRSGGDAAGDGTYSSTLYAGIFQTSKLEIISRPAVQVAQGASGFATVPLKGSYTVKKGDVVAPRLRLSRSRYGLNAGNSTDKVADFTGTILLRKK